MSGRVVFALAGVGEFSSFRQEAAEIAQVHNLRETWVWPQAKLLDANDFRNAHLPLLEGPLSIEAVHCNPLADTRDAIVVVDLETPLFCPRYLAPGATEPFLVPEFAWELWSESQRDWVMSECQAMPLQHLDEIATQGADLVKRLVANNNVVIICEAFEYVSSEVTTSTLSARELACALEDINLLNRNLSADHGALIMHAHTGMAFEGADSLQSDCRKRGKSTASVLTSELQRTLTDGGGMDVFTG